MSLRQAAALALMGWYLMMPPQRQHQNGPPTPDYGEPLSQWEVNDTFDTSAECKAELKRLQDESDRLVKGPPADPGLENDRLWRYSFQCIATDDPRLKEK